MSLQRASLIALTLALTGGACDETPAQSPIADQAPFRYLAATGVYSLDAQHSSAADDRNPARLEMSTSTAPGSVSEFSFYGGADATFPLAVGCQYQYNRSQPDGFLFPNDKRAIWVMFELEPEQAQACGDYRYVAFQPAEDGVLSFRFGTEGYSALVDSTVSNPTSATSWWNRYIPVEGAVAPRPFDYDTANGDVTRDDSDTATASDLRNPSGVTMTTSMESGSASNFVFTQYGDPDKVWADCDFQVRYTMPDPMLFPASKTELWDAFEMVGSNEGECSAFQYVVLRWNADRTQMNLRYGMDGFEPLLALSAADPLAGGGVDGGWWANYCAGNCPAP